MQKDGSYGAALASPTCGARGAIEDGSMTKDIDMNTRWMALVVPPLLALAWFASAQVHAAPVAAYRCGGIGEAEQASFRQDANRHDALVTFSTRGGAYVADTGFQLTNAGGEVVLQGNCSGPLMLLDLPGPGAYRLHARFEGQAQSRTLHAGEKTARVSIVWNAS